MTTTTKTETKCEMRFITLSDETMALVYEAFDVLKKGKFELYPKEFFESKIVTAWNGGYVTISLYASPYERCKLVYTIYVAFSDPYDKDSQRLYSSGIIYSGDYIDAEFSTFSKPGMSTDDHYICQYIKAALASVKEKEVNEDETC